MIQINRPFAVSDDHTINDEHNKLPWLEVSIQVSNQKNYPVYACEINKQVYIKPVKQIFNDEFESLFGFNMKCSDFNPIKSYGLKTQLSSCK